MPIRVLPPDVAARIAAGEVVERPASVVKELVENALDAGADTITVELAEGGRRLIRVGDNGHGIPADEALLAFERHATSKLTDIEDLERITTLGFRGEALASIAAVSRTTLITRAENERMGTRLELEGGEVLRHEPAGAPRGTVITVEDLFFNIPARRKFLKQESTERSLSSALISRYAMAYSGVRFSLIHGGQELLRTTGSGDLHTVLTEVYGVETAAQMLEVVLTTSATLRPDLPPIEVQGFTGQPALARANRNQITIFVNGRWVQDHSLAAAVVQAYHTMLPSGRYPVAVLMVSLPAHEVDVNVHPTKTQVRFRQPNAVFSTVQRAVRRVLVDQAEVPTVHHDILWGSPDWQARRDRLAQVTSSRMSQLGLGVEIDETGHSTKQGPPDSAQSDVDQPTHARKRNLPVMRVIGQVGATYVVTEGPRGMYLIDQHAAHARVLYEQLLAERAGAAVVSQELLEPITVELSPEQMGAAEEGLNNLHAMGFLIETFGRNTLRLRAIPALLSQGDPVDGLMAALGQIEMDGMLEGASSEEQMAARICWQAAVKVGQTLSYAEMQALVRQLEECQMPQISPSGAPTMIHISAEQLAREFGRIDTD